MLVMQIHRKDSLNVKYIDMEDKLRMNALSDEELASVTGGVGMTNDDDDEEFLRCKADCEQRLANVAEIIRLKCITNCRKQFPKKDEF
jgi:bacteriocin-like protein